MAWGQIARVGGARACGDVGGDEDVADQKGLGRAGAALRPGSTRAGSPRKAVAWARDALSQGRTPGMVFSAGSVVAWRP